MAEYNPARVIEIAEAEVGYHEKETPENLDQKTAPNDGSGNWTKYGRDMDRISGFFNGPKSGYEWCAVWVCWDFVQAYGVNAARHLLCLPKRSSAAGCTQAAGYFIAAGQFRTDPQVGDQIFFGSSRNDVDHTGLVEKVTAAYVYTIEGNAENAVTRHRYKKTDGWIVGYGRPRWNEKAEKDPEPDPVPEDPKEEEIVVIVQLRQLQQGMGGEEVRTVQRILKMLNYATGNVDGDFGPLTAAAVQAFQRNMGKKHPDRVIDVDGIVGPVTWDLLLKG